MQLIVAKANIEEQEFVDFIIDCIPDSSNAITQLPGANTIDGLVKRMDRYQSRRQRSTVNKPRSTDSGNQTAAMSEAEIRCNNCSKFGHFQSKFKIRASSAEI